jgi:hypothetical protein
VQAFSLCNIFLTYPIPSWSLQFCEKLNKKAEIKNGHLFRNHCWRELGLGMIANNPNVTMAERMAFSRHTNASSHIAYIRAGHNSDFAFQKAVSGAPLPNKKDILKKRTATKKGVRMAKKKLQKVASIPKKVTKKPKAKAVRKATPPKNLAYMKAPPNYSVSHPHATRSAQRRGVRVPKAKKAI